MKKITIIVEEFANESLYEKLEELRSILMGLNKTNLDLLEKIQDLEEQLEDIEFSGCTANEKIINEIDEILENDIFSDLDFDEDIYN